MNILQTIKQRTGIRQSLTNIGWLSSDRILRMLGAVIVGTVVARYLGPSRFGSLNYALAIYGIFNLISNLGLDSLVVRDIALEANNESQVLGTAFVLKAAASVVTTIAATATAWVMEPQNTTVIIIVALMSFASISQAVDVVDYFFQSQTRSQYSVMPRSIAFVAASAARLVAVSLHMSLMAFAWIAAIEVLVMEIGLGISYIRIKRLMPRWNWHLPRAKALLSESWPLLIAGVMINVYMRTDQILLGKLASMETVGVYSAAIRLSEVWYAIPMIVTASVMPRLLKTRALHPERYYARLQTFYESMILVSVIVVIGTLIFGPLAIRLLYGRQFSSAAGILSIHIWSGVFVAVGCIGGHQYVHEGITVSSVQRTGLGAIANVILNLLWIPHWGGMGSAMATLVAQGLGSYLGDAFDPRTRHIFRMKTQAYLRFWKLPGRIFQGETR